jgi:nucleotide-binding universal stress UspA family protein
MKTILIPTDFSESANNAIEYAVEMAKIMQAKIILFHVYNVALIPSDANIVLPLEDVEHIANMRLKKSIREIQLNHGVDLIVEYASKCGMAQEEINCFAEENQVDIIVMSTEGAGYLKEKIIGSTTTSVIKKAKCPVLSINKKVKYKAIKRIAFACDYNQANNKSSLATLENFCSIFNSELYVINVVDELEMVPTIDEAAGGIKVEHLLKNFNHSSFYIKNNDVVNGINKFVDEKEIDLVVMIPHVHTVLENLLHEPNTKRMAFHIKVPLLTLH